MKSLHKPILTALRIGLPLLLTLGWLAFIFGNSLRTGVESGEQSHKVFELVHTVTRSLGIQKIITEAFIRKAAHFTEFAILSLLFCMDLVAFKVVTIHKKLYFSIPILSSSILVCLCCAIIDETLQHFSTGRAPQLQDVGIDTLGAVCGTGLFIAIFIVIYLPLKRSQGKKST